LGLAVVKTVTEAHGGALALDSAPERGTKFELDLPRRAEVEPPPTPPAPAAREVA
jgi:signal transduction histidine kinase